MSDREEILAAVRKQRPGSGSLGVRESGSSGVREPERPEFGVRSPEGLESRVPGSEVEDLLQQFIGVVREIGGDVVQTEREMVREVLRERFPDFDPVDSAGVDGKDLVSLQSMELFVCEGVLGVAENGAIWIPESNMGARVAPFIAQHLAVMLDSSQIAANMHQAYERIDVAAEGFGVFVAGPSKTADIEQSLVLGAHGPRSLLVVLV